jgi:hypothetical protein
MKGSNLEGEFDDVKGYLVEQIRSVVETVVNAKFRSPGVLNLVERNPRVSVLNKRVFGRGWRASVRGKNKFI